MWNVVFNNWEYRNCFSSAVNVTFEDVSKGEAVNWTGERHQVFLLGAFVTWVSAGMLR